MIINVEKYTEAPLAKRLGRGIFSPDGRGRFLFPQLIEIARTLGGNGPRPPLRVAMEDESHADYRHHGLLVVGRHDLFHGEH